MWVSCVVKSYKMCLEMSSSDASQCSLPLLITADHHSALGSSGASVLWSVILTLSVVSCVSCDPSNVGEEAIFGKQTNKAALHCRTVPCKSTRSHIVTLKPQSSASL
ncbi:hypothetical protein GOODEAATRI_021555 [Goodea atripinnis]|uniref:Secreted protein n=1 Tax=Goodea atripinnis TaxID=208336 RepID=A0ABV0PZW8_9TELE